MCPGCRALLGPGESPCPYCGWDVDRTAVRREGGTVERALRPVGGIVPVLIGMNVLFYLISAMADARLAQEAAGDAVPLLDRVFQGLLGPRSETLVRVGANVPELVMEGEAWRLLCPVFLHGGLLHIGCNMLSLRSIGGAVEEAYGAGKALAIYLLAGLVGNLASVAWLLWRGPVVRDGHLILVPRIGASGAIIGFAGVLAALGLRIGGEAGRALWVPMVKSVGFILVLGLALAYTGGPVAFDNSAHIGGFAFGFGAGWICTFGIRARGRPAAVRAWDAAAIVLSLFVLLSFVPPALSLAAVPR